MAKILSRVSLIVLVVFLVGLFAIGREQAEAGESNDEWRTYVVLEKWGKARRAAPQMHYTFTWTTIDNSPFANKGEKTRLVFKGEVFLQWPDRLKVVSRDEEGVLTHAWVVEGRDARTYDFGKKVETNYVLPRKYRLLEVAESCLDRSRLSLTVTIREQMLWHVLGPPPLKLGRRFESRMRKVDDHWHYIGLEPINRWGWFPDQEWQIVLHKKDGWLRQVWNANAVVDFEKPDHKPLPASTWGPIFEDLPKGWTSSDIDLSKSLAE